MANGFLARWIAGTRGEDATEEDGVAGEHGEEVSDDDVRQHPVVGLLTPDEVQRQKESRARDLEEQFRLQVETLNSARKRHLDELRDASDQQKRSFELWKDQQVKQQELALRQHYDQQVMAMHQAVKAQLAEIDRKASLFALEWQQRQVQKDLTAGRRGIKERFSQPQKKREEDELKEAMTTNTASASGVAMAPDTLDPQRPPQPSMVGSSDSAVSSASWMQGAAGVASFLALSTPQSFLHSPPSNARPAMPSLSDPAVSYPSFARLEYVPPPAMRKSVSPGPRGHAAPAAAILESAPPSTPSVPRSVSPCLPGNAALAAARLVSMAPPALPLSKPVSPSPRALQHVLPPTPLPRSVSPHLWRYTIAGPAKLEYVPPGTPSLAKSASAGPAGFAASGAEYAWPATPSQPRRSDSTSAKVASRRKSANVAPRTGAVRRVAPPTIRSKGPTPKSFQFSHESGSAASSRSVPCAPPQQPLSPCVAPRIVASTPPWSLAYPLRRVSQAPSGASEGGDSGLLSRAMHRSSRCLEPEKRLRGCDVDH